MKKDILMKKIMLLSSVLLIAAQLEAAQRMLVAATQTGSWNGDSESNDDNESDTESVSSLSQAYRTARTSPAPVTTASRGTQTQVKIMATAFTQTDGLASTSANPVPSARPEEVAQEHSPEYLDEKPEETKQEKDLAILQEASKKVDQHTFGVHDKIAIPALAVLTLMYLDKRKVLGDIFLSSKALGALAAVGALGLADMVRIRKNYFTSEFLPVAITSGGGALATFFTKNSAFWSQDFYPFAFGAVLGTTAYTWLHIGRIFSTPLTPPANQTRAIKN